MRADRESGPSGPRRNEDQTQNLIISMFNFNKNIFLLSYCEDL